MDQEETKPNEIKVPFIAVLLSWVGRTHILDGPVFGGWVRATFSFRWMQRDVPAAAHVTVNIQFSGTGGASSRTETVSLFKN
jgi:hypothetical protein